MQSFLLSGYLASSFRPIDVCMDRTCARLCVYVCLFWGVGTKMEGERKFALVSKMLKPWDINAFARQHDGLMVQVLCVFVEKKYVAHFVQFRICIEG